MITEYTRYRVPADAAEQFEAAYARAAVPLAAAPQCVDYDLTRCVEEPACYILRITWTSAQDHLHGFRGSAAFQEFFAEIKPYLGAIEEMRHYEATGVSGIGRGHRTAA